MEQKQKLYDEIIRKGYTRLVAEDLLQILTEWDEEVKPADPSRAKAEQEGLRWIPIEKWGKQKRNIEQVLIKYETGEIRRMAEEDQPGEISTHFMDLTESTTPSFREEFAGSVFSQPAPGITLGCISPEANELLDTIMKAWDECYPELQKTAPHAETTFYGFAYWLVRWSGLVQSASAAPVKEAGQSGGEELPNNVHDRIIANQKAGMSLEQAIYRTGYDDGQHSRQQPGGESAGVWRRATDELPELNKPICFRIYERRYAGKMIGKGIFSHDGYPCTYGVGSVSWLDESASTKEREVAFAE